MVSSRLARHEQEKLLTQTLLFIVGAIVLALLFIFVVLPGFVRLVTGSNAVSPLGSSDTIPPQIPVLAPPPEATPSAQIALTGYGEAKSSVVLVLNGTQQGEAPIGDDGAFSIDVPLTEGENMVAIFARDEAGNESNTTNPITIIQDTTAPKLEVNEPQDAQQVELRRNQVITVKGATDPGTTVTLNGRRVFTQADGSFTTTFQLQEGDNTLQFVAMDKAGNKSEKAVAVHFKL